jgi:hypothetical protein
MVITIPHFASGRKNYRYTQDVYIPQPEAWVAE